MIIKVQGVSADTFAQLVAFMNSDQNKMQGNTDEHLRRSNPVPTVAVVTLKEARQEGEEYHVTLQTIDKITTGDINTSLGPISLEYIKTALDILQG